MTETVVTDGTTTVVAENTVTDIIVTDESTTVVSDNNVTQVIVTGIMGPPGASTLAQLLDVDKTNLVDGATLVYNQAASTWEATNLLNNQIFEAGQF